MKKIAPLLFLLLAVATASGQSASAVAQFYELVEAEKIRAKERPPIEDLSPESIAREEQLEQELLRKLQALEVRNLAGQDQLNYLLFYRQAEQQVLAQRFRSYTMPVTQLWGTQVDWPSYARNLSLRDTAAVAAYLKQLKRIPSHIRQTTVLLKQGIAEGRTMPAIPLRGVPEQIKNLVEGEAEQSVFYQPLENLPAAVGQEESMHIRQTALALISREIKPAYQRFYTFFSDTCLPNARTEAGVWSIPLGDEWYRNRVAFHTTTSYSPEEIHRIGLAEVARLRKEMTAIIAEVGFAGSFDEFVHFLRTDPQFYYTDKEIMLRDYRDICKRIDGLLPGLFRKLPGIPYGVAEIPEQIAPTTYTAYYQPPPADGTRAGFFCVNTYKLETRPKYEMEALAIHEAVPGHHLQIALAMELQDLPEFRLQSRITAFVEGWALYSESLGRELGMYRDPYSRFGQLTYEMWRACRLVVDTGMHSMHWSRQQAIDYMLGNTAKTEHDIANEVDRYMVWPGQALAYKVGELKIRELLQLAKTGLGEAFDIRDFHHAVLENGAIPLETLEQQIKAYISAVRSAKTQ